jgi:glycosyltransferase involved in cell wall biosynthesis
MRPFLAPPAPAGARAGDPPTFSVVIAAYQAADVVGEAIQSALEQTTPPLEVIVCDDGSTDDVESAVAPYLSRIRFLRKTHGGEASAKNAAAAVATGEFVAILDADDIYAPERLEALAELASARPDLDILTTDAILEVDGLAVRRCYDEGWTFEIVDQRREILRRNFIFGLAAVRRERLLEAGGFDEAIRWTTDWDCWLRLILAGSHAGAVDEPLAVYRLRETSLSARRLEMVRGKIQTLEKAQTSKFLLPRERRELDRALAGYRREHRLAELERALRDADPTARGRAAGIVGGRGFRSSQRATAAVSAVAPGRAGRAVRKREQRTWVGAGGIRVEREQTVPRKGLRVVLYTDTRGEIGGAERSLANLAAALTSDVDVAVLGVDEAIVRLVAEARPGTTTRVVPFIESRLDLKAILAHVRALRELRPAVFHANLTSPSSGQVAILLALLLPRTATVAVEQLPRPEPRWTRRFAKRILSRRVRAHVAVGKGAAHEVERLAGLRPGSLGVVYNGVPDATPQAAERFSAGPTIGTTARLEQQKGVDVLLRALPLLPDVTAVVAGDGSERRQLRELARSLGVSERVVWLGWCDEPRRHLGALDVFVLPSRSEGFPLAIVEAMLAGLPVVASDVGSVREAVLDGHTGVLVPPDDVEALARALRELLDDPAGRRELGRRGRELALERFTATAMAREFERLYAAITS